MEKKIAVLDERGQPINAPIVWYSEEGCFLWSCGAKYYPEDGAEGVRRFLERLTVASAADEKAVLLSADVVTETTFAVRLQRAGRRQAVALFDDLDSVRHNLPAWLLSLRDLRKAVG